MEVPLLKAKELTGTVEAILFASGEPVSIEKIAQVIDVTYELVEETLALLEDKFNKPTSGINLIRINQEVQFCTNPVYITPVRDILDIKRNTPLSGAAMEVLSLVAYNEPVTKAFIEQVRGVDCSGVLGSLTQKGLVEERGRLELPGRPLLYGTTSTFLRCFNISSLDELPPIPEENSEEKKDNNSNSENIGQKNDIIHEDA